MEEMWAAALKQVDRMRTDFHLLCVTVPAKVRRQQLPVACPMPCSASIFTF
jgi:hypothetical protein